MATKFKEDTVVEFVPIILWKNDENLRNIIKKTFNVVDNFILTFNKDELKIKLEELYYPHKLKINDPRICSQNIEILVLKMIDPTYKIFSRSEHINKPLNETIINF
jgi:hypothetical protein